MRNYIDFTVPSDHCLESFIPDYGGLSTDCGISLVNDFTARLAGLTREVKKTGARLFEIAKLENAVHTDPSMMVEFAPGMSYELDNDGVVNAVIIEEYDLLPENLTVKELKFVQSWFEPGRAGLKSGWLEIIQLTLALEEGLYVIIEGDYPETVAVYIQ